MARRSRGRSLGPPARNINIRMPSNLMTAIEELGQAEGVTNTSLIVRALLREAVLAHRASGKPVLPDQFDTAQ